VLFYVNSNNFKNEYHTDAFVLSPPCGADCKPHKANSPLDVQLTLVDGHVMFPRYMTSNVPKYPTVAHVRNHRSRMTTGQNIDC
jgi:hypothetical protein